jgi:hypothetical protein
MAVRCKMLYKKDNKNRPSSSKRTQGKMKIPCASLVVFGGYIVKRCSSI